jgi:hypothetical protein
MQVPKHHYISIFVVSGTLGWKSAKTFNWVSKVSLNLNRYGNDRSRRMSFLTTSSIEIFLSTSKYSCGKSSPTKLWLDLKKKTAESPI